MSENESHQQFSEAQDDKARAEAEKIRQDMVNAQRKADLDARKAEAEIAKAEADALAVTLEAEALRRSHEELLARDEFHNLYRFTGAVTDDTVRACMRSLTAWHRNAPGSDIELVFYSPGGSVTAGLALWDFIQDLKKAGHKITTVVNGMAASMAGILLQAGSVRIMGEESYLMIHEISFGAQGKLAEIEDTTDWVKKVQERVKRIFAERSNLTVEELESMWRRKDCWLDSADALEKGLIDAIR